MHAINTDSIIPEAQKSKLKVLIDKTLTLDSVLPVLEKELDKLSRPAPKEPASEASVQSPSAISPELTLNIIEDVIQLLLEAPSPVTDKKKTLDLTNEEQLDIIEDAIKSVLEKENQPNKPTVIDITPEEQLAIIEDVIMLYDANKSTNV
jgi:hypothetical protein